MGTAAQLKHHLSRTGIHLGCLVLIGVGLSSGCALFSTEQHAAPDQTTIPSAPLRIPFKRHGHHIYVWVSINGSPPAWFILDSGAAHTIISQPLAQSRGLRGQGRLTIRGVGTQTIPAVKTFDVGLSVAGVAWRSPEAWVVPPRFFTPLTQYFGYSFAGIIGSELFSQYVVEIDYQAQSLYLHNPQHYKYQGSGYQFPLKLRRGKPYVEAQVTAGPQQVDSLLLVDIGSGSALSLRGNLPPSLRSNGQALLSRLTLGVGGTKPIQVGRVDRLRLGDLTLEQLVANLELRPDQSRQRLGGRIGNQVLERFRVIFNYARQRLILVPQAEGASQNYDYDMSGLWVHAEGDAWQTVKIAQIFADSPAAQADLAVGDQIIAIDNQPVDQLKLPQVRQLLKGPVGQIRTLKVQRGQTQFEVDLQLKRLI